MLLAKIKLNAIEVLISKVLIDFNILIMMNLFQLIMSKENVIRWKKKIKTSEHSVECTTWKPWKLIMLVVKNNLNSSVRSKK